MSTRPPELSEEELLLVRAAGHVRWATLCVHMAVTLLPDEYEELAAELEDLRTRLGTALTRIDEAADACPLEVHTRGQAP